MVVMLAFRFFCPVSEGSDDGHQIRFFKLPSQFSGTAAMAKRRVASGRASAEASRTKEVARWRHAPARSSSSSQRFKKISMCERLYAVHRGQAVRDLTDGKNGGCLCVASACRSGGACGVSLQTEIGRA